MPRRLEAVAAEAQVPPTSSARVAMQSDDIHSQTSSDSGGLRPAVLMVSPHGWFDVWQRPHHLASRFARWADVAYLSPRWLRQAMTGGRDWRRHRGAPCEGGPRLESPLMINGERHWGWLRQWNRRSVARAAVGVQRRLAGRPLVVWLYDPHQVHVLDVARPAVAVYDIMDDFTAFPWAPPGVEEEENQLLRRADLVFAGTWALHDSRRGRAERIVCETSGVEVEHFARSLEGAGNPEARRRGRAGRPWSGAAHVAGYAGTLDERIDEAALAEAARALPDWAFVLVGPKKRAFPRWGGLPNIHLAGARSYEDLPALYWGWDVGLIPFARNRWTDALNPTKTLEYFAAGLPVASSEIPDLARLYAEEIAFYRTASDLAGVLRAAVEAESAAARERRLALARERSWDAIAERMWSAVVQELPNIE